MTVLSRAAGASGSTACAVILCFSVVLNVTTMADSATPAPQQPALATAASGQ
jgi:hypothetical protein